MKGRHVSPAYEFKKGHIPVAPFKKGHIPWTKGKKLIFITGAKNPNCDKCGGSVIQINYQVEEQIRKIADEIIEGK